MLAAVRSATLFGVEGRPVTVEVHVAGGLPSFQIVGLPDPKYGEELAAWIKLKAGQQATPDELRDYCKKQLAHFKVPRHIKFVDAFPQTVTGKILTAEDQKRLAEETQKQLA